MEVVRREEVIVKDGQIRLKGLPYKRGDRVEVIVLPRGREAGPQVKLTVGQLRRSGLIGLWQDRTDIEDSSAYARQLREQAQRRGEVE
ncbi:MAG: hypothetical protein Kow0063_27500 [Anaerolineae bacterium]